MSTTQDEIDAAKDASVSRSSPDSLFLCFEEPISDTKTMIIIIIIKLINIEWKKQWEHIQN